MGHGRYLVMALALLVSCLISPESRSQDAVTEPLNTFATGFEGFNKATFSPDGTRILAGSGGSTARLWDTATGSLLHTFSGHTNTLLSAAFSPDGTQVLTGSEDHTARLWSTATGAAIRTFSGHTGWVHDAAFSPDGTQVLTGSSDTTMRLWDVATGNLIRTFNGHTDDVFSVAFSKDGTRALTGGFGAEVRLWTVATGATLNTFFGSYPRFSTDGSQVLTGSEGGPARLRDGTTGALIRSFGTQVWMERLSLDGKQVLTASFNNMFHLWDTATGNLIRTFTGHTGRVVFATFVGDGTHVLTGSEDNTVRMWDLSTGDTVRIFIGHTDWPFHGEISPDGTKVLTSSYDGTSRLWSNEAQEDEEDPPVPVTDAISREFSVNVGDPNAVIPAVDAISREFSVNVGDPNALIPVRDAISREFSVNVGDPSAFIPVREAISREFSVNVGDPASYVPVKDAVSREFSVYVPVPDLTITALTAPSSVGVGESLSVQWDLANIGHKAATSPWQDCLYLSSDNTLGNDTQLDCYSHTEALEPGNTSTVSLNVMTPAVTPGTYWLIAQTDQAYAISEVDEQNNTRVFGPIKVLPTLIPVEEASSTVIPSFGGDGLALELYLGIGGGGAPRPADLTGRIPDGAFLAPYLDFPNPGGTVQISSNFTQFFASTIVPPDSVRDLQPQRFTLRSSTLLKVTEALDKDPATPEIDLEVGVGSDDGYYLEVGNRFQGQAGDRGFSYSWHAIRFESEGLYPLDLLFAANNSGFSGLELAWRTQAGESKIPQESLYRAAPGCDTLVEFDDFEPGTVLENQLAGQGLVFETLSGQPQVTDARPGDFVPVSGTRVLADPRENPSEEVVLELRFVDPATGGNAVTNYFSCYVIDAEEVGAKATVYDSLGEVLETRSFNLGGASQEFAAFSHPGMNRIVFNLGQGADTAALDNLCFTTPMPYSLPKLIPSSLTIQSATAIGESVVVSWDVRNEGGPTMSTSWRDCVYLSDDNMLGDDVLLDCQIHAGSMALDESYTGAATVVMPEITEGTYWVVLSVDEDHEVRADDPSDNVLIQGPITITRADLSVLDVTLPSEAAPSESIEIGWAVVNTGSGLAAAAWTDKVYLSPDNALGDDIYLGEQLYTDDLESGGFYFQSSILTLPDIPNGDYYIVVTADANNELPDVNREDSTRIAGTISVSRPDLTVALLNAPAQADSGSSVHLAWQVENHGELRTAHAWSDCVYLSTDNLPGDDQLVACIPRLNDLGVGESYDHGDLLQLPQVSEGSYWLYLVADGENTVPETDETNNRSEFIPITIASPNLTPSSLSAPELAVSGQRIDVTWSVENDSIASIATEWRDAIYLSTDANTGDDVLLGTFGSPSTLEAGANYSQSGQVNLPDIPNGQYWLVVVIDDSGSVAEQSETDNTQVFGPVEVSRTDVSVTTFEVQTPSPRSEGAITLAWQVTNQTDLPTRHSWRDCFYVSSDAVAGNDTVIGCVERIRDLAADDAYSAQTTLNLPSLAEGSYWFVVHSDAENSVPETDEANNARVIGPIHVRLVLPPVIAPVQDDTLEPGQAYTGPEPVLTQGTAPVTWSLETGPSGMVIDGQTGVVNWPATIEGLEPHTVSIRATNEAGSDIATWNLNVPVSYTATVSTPINIVSAGTPIPLLGTATRLDTGGPAANKPVSIRIWVQDALRVIDVVTDGDGAFSTVFNPLPREGGRYTVGADHPLVMNDKIDDEFSILALGVTPEKLTQRLTPGQELQEELVLRNNGDQALTGITYDVEGAPPGLAVGLAPLPDSIAPRAEVSLKLSLLGSPGANQHNEIIVRLRSAEGALASLLLSTEVVPPTPQLVAAPGTLKAGMLVGEQRFAETVLTNIGGMETGALEILVPQAPWLALSTPQLLPSLAPGQSAGVTLSLTPEAGMQLGPYNGYYRVQGAQSNLTVPFVFSAISDAKGDLKITVVDEFTFFAEDKPNVAGALLALSDPYTGEPINYADPDSGDPVVPMTGPDGTFTFRNLPEGYYDISISASGHAPHRGAYLVSSGGLEEVQVFISRQLVSYTWNVSPTEIEDHYDISVDVTFETHVPAPVVTVEPPFIDLTDMTEPVKQFDLTFSNHGLIAAEELEVTFTSNDQYTIIPLVEKLGTMPPLTSFVVPVIVYDNTALTKSASPEMLSRIKTRQSSVALDPRASSVQKNGAVTSGDPSGAATWSFFCYFTQGRSFRIGVRTRRGGDGTFSHGIGGGGGGGGGSSSPSTISMGVPCGCPNEGQCTPGSLKDAVTKVNGSETDVYAPAEEEVTFTIEDVKEEHTTVVRNCVETPLVGQLEYTWELYMDGSVVDTGTGESVPPFIPIDKYTKGGEFYVKWTVKSDNEECSIVAQDFTSPIVTAVEIVTETTFTAPQNNDPHRTKIGFGEIIDVKTIPSVNATWTATFGCVDFRIGPTTRVQASEPVKAGFIVATLPDGKTECRVEFQIVTPDFIYEEVPGKRYHVNGKASAGFEGKYQLVPLDVSFVAIQFKEGAGPPPAKSGFFDTSAAGPHPEGPEWIPVLPTNYIDGSDFTAIWAHAGPYCPGTLRVTIPLHYRLAANLSLCSDGKIYTSEWPAISYAAINAIGDVTRGKRGPAQVKPAGFPAFLNDPTSNDTGRMNNTPGNCP